MSPVSNDQESTVSCTIRSQSIDEMEEVHLGYQEPDVGKHCGTKRAVRISAMPEQLRESARRLDVHHTGELGTHEVSTAILNLDRKNKSNRNLKKTLGVAGVVVFLLIAAVFGASITAARLSKELVVDHESGFAYAKGTHQTMKTSQAVSFAETNFGSLSNEELGKLKEIRFANGDLRFVVKGHARDKLLDRILLLVEGGTIAFDSEGITHATGDAKLLLDATFGPPEETGSGRGLASQCYDEGPGLAGWWM